MTSDLSHAELTKEVISSIRVSIANGNSVFADKRYLDALFLPSKIVGRQKQAEEILRQIESIRSGFVVPLISVYGRSGSGKSTVVKFVCQNIDDISSFAFVNLRKSKTVFGSSNLILAELGESNLTSAEGINKAIDTIGKKIEEKLRVKDKNLFLLVLDEYDSIFSDLRGNPSDFIYKLLDLEKDLREKGLWLCIVTISNNALADYNLDDRVKSRIGNCEIFFPPYDQDNLKNILRERAEKAFAIKISKDVLDYCSQLGSDDHGDARRALELLRYAGECCDGKTLTRQDVDNANQSIQKDRVATIVSCASYHLKTVIGAICSNILKTRESWTATSSVYDTYKSILPKEKKPLSYRRIVDLLIELENTGLVVSRTLSRGRYGYGTEYKLKISPEIIGPLVNKEWWEEIVDRKEANERCDKFFDELQNIFSRKK